MSDYGLGRVGLWSFDLDTQPMSLAQDAVQRIEQMGFDTVWVPEAVGREPFASCATLLSATRTLKMATGIANIHARTAHTMQAGWKTLTEAFPGRFILGLGVSHQPMVEGAHKSTYSKPYSTMVEYLDRMDEGIFFGAAPTTQPQRVLAALGPKMLKLSAERSLGAHPYFTPVEHTEVARKELGVGPLLAPEVAVIFETDAIAARAIARKYMATYLRLPNYTNNLRRLGWTEEDITGPSDALVDAICVWGTTDQVMTRIQAHIDAGADHVCVQVLTATPKVLPFDLWQELADATKGLSS
jgi:probable F420-dependent oxidoreductase